MNVKSIIRRVIKENIWMIIGFGVTLALSLFAVYYIPSTIVKLVDNRVKALSNPLIVANVKLCIHLFGVTVCALAAFFLMKTLVTNFQYKLDKHIKQECYSSVLKSDFIDLDKLTLGEAYSKIDESSTRITKDFVATGIIKFCLILLYGLAMIITLFLIHPIYGVIEFVFAAIFMVIKYLIKSVVLKKSIDISEALKVNRKYLNKVSANIKEIKISNEVESEEKHYMDILEQEHLASRRLTKILDIDRDFTIYFFTLISSVIAVISVAGIKGDVSIGSIAGSLVIVPLLYICLFQITKTYPNGSYYRDDFNSLNSILNIRPENRVITIPELKDVDTIKFEDVTFEYWNNDFTLKDLNFQINKGESIGIFGMESSGRSSIAYLITRLIRPKVGKVLINNNDVNRIDAYSLRRVISISSSEFILYKGTVRDNIVGNDPVDEYLLNDTVHKCLLQDVIKRLPHGLDTKIDNETTMLTESDREKIIIARSYYKLPSVFIFDKLFNAMSNEDFDQIFENISKKDKNIVIVISQNQHMLSKCSKIMMLEDGRVCEFAPSKELLKNTNSKVYKYLSELKKKKKGN